MTTFVFDERFAEGFFHAPRRRVLGRRLEPFSYWHKVQLEYVQSRFLTGGGVGMWDVWVAVRICTTRYPATAGLRAVYPAWWQLLWQACYGWRNVKRGIAGMVAHINDYASGPKLWPKGGSKRRLAEAYEALARETGDRSLLVKAAQATQAAELEAAGKRDIDDSVEQVAIYMKHAGRPAPEAWNMPLGALLWYNACFLKMEGAEVPIWSPTDEMFFEQHKRQRHQKLLERARGLREENPVLTESLAFALASVAYWEEVVESQAASVGKG